MKLLSIKPLLLVTVMAVVCLSCGSGSGKSDEGVRDWAEMDAYHMLMAEAFHPYMDSSNLEPAKKLAPQLLEDAKEWESSKLPSRVNNETTKASLRRLTTLAEKLNQDIQSADDSAIGSSLDSLHEVFHELQNHWYAAAGANSGHDHHHDHDHEHNHDHDHGDHKH